MLQDARPKYTEYDDPSHKYYVDGREFLSVTTILDLAGFVSPYARDEVARERGIAVHRLTAEEDGRRKANCTFFDLRQVRTEWRGYMRAWRKYREESGFMPELIEHRIDCHEAEYAGRIDRFGVRPTRDPLKFQQVVLDIKTSTTGAVADYVKFQLAAYGNALEKGKAFERIAVALKPDGTYNCRIFPLHDYFRDVAEFLQISKRVKSSLCQQ